MRSDAYARLAAEGDGLGSEFATSGVLSETDVRGGGELQEFTVEGEAFPDIDVKIDFL